MLKYPAPPNIAPQAEMGPRPFWSVMIPTFNRTNYLERALTSVLSQDPGPEVMQIEISDNASSADDLEPLVRRVGGDRVSFVRQPCNIGLFPNFNSCIERSRGEWVHILADDDVVFPGFYSGLKSALEGRNDLGAAFCRTAVINENERCLRTSELQRPTAGVLAGFLEKVASANRICSPGMVVRRSVYEQLGGFRLCLPYSADWEMWIRIAAHYPIWYEPAILVAWREHSNNATTGFKNSGENFVDLYRCIEISRAWLPPDRAETISWRAKEWVYNWSQWETSQDDEALRLVEEFVKFSQRSPINRAFIANELLRAAHIRHRQGRGFQALIYLCRAVLTRPIVAGRPVKRAVNYLFAKSQTQKRER